MARKKMRAETPRASQTAKFGNKLNGMKLVLGGAQFRELFRAGGKSRVFF
jgi:hypothetical protein